MEKDLKGVSWALGIWGVLSVIFGALIVAWPGITLKAFMVILAAYFVATGLVMLVGSLVNHTGKWVSGAVIGFLSVIAGLYVFANPQLSGAIVLFVIAVWAVAAGLLQIVAGFEGKNNWWLIISGFIYTLFGLYMFRNPAGGALALVWVIGLSTIAGGIALVITAFEANSASKQVAAGKKA